MCAFDTSAPLPALDTDHEAAMLPVTTALPAHVRTLTGLLALGASTAAADTPFSDEMMEAFAETHPELVPEAVPEVDAEAPRVIRRGGSEKQIALTFDACSTWDDTDYDPDVVDILRQTDTPATLFLGGLWMAQYQDETRELHADSLFEIGNHGHSHRDMTAVDDDTIERELAFTQLIATALTGEAPRYFRAPYVRKNEEVVTQAAAQGLPTVQYDVASGDADADVSADDVARHVIDQAEAGSIVVLHMNDPELPTAEALPEIIAGLRERGYELVTVGELDRNAD